MKFKRLYVYGFATLIAILLILFLATEKNHKHTLIINTFKTDKFNEVTFFDFKKENNKLFKNVIIKYNGTHKISLIKFSNNSEIPLNFLEISKKLNLKNDQYQVSYEKKLIINILYIIFYYFIFVFLISIIIKKN